MPSSLLLSMRNYGEKREKQNKVYKVGTSSKSSALLAIPSFGVVPCHAPPNRRAYSYPKDPWAPTMTDETKPAQLANRNPGEAAPAARLPVRAAGAPHRFSSLSFLPSEARADIAPPSLFAPIPWDAWLALTPGSLLGLLGSRPGAGRGRTNHDI